ncbi:MAG: UV DNA damage repair endonuclease UvsE [Candidatus Omnitrophica bacterium]|nr:UV DNA damage repair endonuclease UvsE [Candidatus Omnitrophota bacterium]MBU1127741.1 UV DNA damage repair endonuclease UvsE [Candidatus Omnitrophota bacterium]MBU1783716.1 UV DNA damage repair endonuclease UvsE [Candidatus Omnitrophota bacterium]MBU1851765.1 UV DNA damage repair endonuclease UvsE [Candidatus Omnitrophota bacterium]
MKIGYPCINSSIGCTANHTFRLASYSEKRFIETVAENIACLDKILRFNLENNIMFFRIGSDLVPFASHPVCTFNWVSFFQKDFKKIGDFTKKHGMRISMHPDQFVLINAIKEEIVQKSVSELQYHRKVLDAMGLDQDAKIQIHVGGVYGDKASAIERFAYNYKLLDTKTKKRLVIENDDRLYSLKDCLEVHRKTSVPVLFDCFHHECLNNNESLRKAVLLAHRTWKKKDGCPLLDYSEQAKNKRSGAHAASINIRKFKKFLEVISGIDFDIMLEIKDKEKSALKAVQLLKSG